MSDLTVPFLSNQKIFTKILTMVLMTILPTKRTRLDFLSLKTPFFLPSHFQNHRVKKREKLHVTLAETSLFCQLGIQGTVKTINITEETNMKEVSCAHRERKEENKVSLPTRSNSILSLS